MAHLNSFTTRDLYRMKALADEADRAALDLSGLRAALIDEIARRSGDTLSLRTLVCPSCGSGSVVISQQGSVRYEICVDERLKAGCGWSRML